MTSRTSGHSASASSAHLLAPPPAAVGGDDERGAKVLDARLERLGRKAAEHDAVHHANPRAGQHRHRQFGNHRHVDDGAVTRLVAAGLEHVGEAAHHGVQFLKSDLAFVARLTLPEDGNLVFAGRLQVPVQAVVRGVDLAADEPFDKRRVPFKNVRPLLEPGQLAFGELSPELLGRFDRPVIERPVGVHPGNIGPCGKLGTGRIHVLFTHVGFPPEDCKQ